MENKEFLESNRDSWNKRTPVHIESQFYSQEDWLKGKNSLNSIELELLGDLKGKSVLHLQCHFGQDSISMARMGAEVVGVDLSPVAVAKATEFSSELKADATFICANVLQFNHPENRQFDLVFASYGTIVWLPDLSQWAEVIYKHLKPGGRFVFAEFHPLTYALSPNFAEWKYTYFNVGPAIEKELGTYADPSAPIESTTYTWNHSMSEILNSLIKVGFRIQLLNEYDYSPYNCFEDLKEEEPGKWRNKNLGSKLPMVFALDCEKPAE
jgi:SAM-dependent methyltransferase